MQARVAAVLALSFTVLGAGCGDDDELEVTRAGWVYIGPVGDGGWTSAHDSGRLQVEQELTGVETGYVENVSDSDAEAATTAIRTFATEGGYDIIFTTSYGFMNPTHTLAAELPDVKWEHCSGWLQAANETNFFARVEQARYLTGIVAAHHVGTGKKMGFVAAFPIPEVIRGINAFTLGARSVDPEITVEVSWTNSWFDMTAEKASAEALIAGGATVLAQHQDSQATILAAQTAGIYAIGYDSDMMSAAPATVLTSAIFNWGPYYVSRVQAVQDGTWTNAPFWGGLAEGVVDIGTYGTAVVESEKNEVATVRASIESGAKNIFAGPIHKQDGSVWVAEGSAISDADQLSMSDFVEGVIGTIPTTK